MEDQFTFFYFIVAVVIIVSMWKIFVKAGRKGWEAIIPIYNLYIIQKLIKKPWWWILLMFIPWLGLIWTIWSTNLLAKTFGKKEGFTVGLVLLPFIFYPMMAFDSSVYTEPKSDDNDDTVIEAEVV